MLATDTRVQFRRNLRERKIRPVTMYEGWTSFHDHLGALDTSSTSHDHKMPKNTFIYDLNEKKFMSCSNLANIKHVQRNALKNTPHIKRTLSIRRPKSLQRLTDELRPLLDAASSLSSIGSFNELTEESVLDSSDDSRSKDINNVILRKGGKLRSLKHRPRSSVLSDRSLSSIPENLLTQNLRKRLNLNAKSLNHIANENKSNGIENITVDVNIKDINNTSKPHLKDNDKNLSKPHSLQQKKNTKSLKYSSRTQNEQNVNLPTKCTSLQNIAIPRRRSTARTNTLSQAVSSSSISEQSFSKEQKRRLKKKMRDTKKSPEKTVFLGLF